MTQIKIKQLTFAFHEKQNVLSNVNCEFDAGQFIGLIGPNGAGKSTLLQLICKTLKVQSGEIFIKNKNIDSFQYKQLAQLISFVPQNAHIDFEISVEDIVSMGRNPHLSRFKLPSEQDREIVAKAISQTGLEHLKQRNINTLSGGEQQRVFIARAIAQQTPVILLDEATANLDISHQLEILELAKTLANQGKLLIAAIHDLNMAARFCDKLLLLAQQDIQAFDLPQNVLTQDRLKQYFAIDAKIEQNSQGHLFINALQAIKLFD